MSGSAMEERNNVPVPRRKLRYGMYGEVSEEDGYEKPYSDELDHSIGSTSLNARPRMNAEQHSPKKFSKKLRGETGLIFKEPLY